VAPAHRHATESSDQGEVFGSCHQTEPAKLGMCRRYQRTTAKRFSPRSLIICTRMTGWRCVSIVTTYARPMRTGSLRFPTASFRGWGVRLNGLFDTDLVSFGGHAHEPGSSLRSVRRLLGCSCQCIDNVLYPLPIESKHAHGGHDGTAGEFGRVGQKLQQ
jgi:hypothetical protein